MANKEQQIYKIDNLKQIKHDEIKENKAQRKCTLLSSSSCDGDSRSVYSGSDEHEKSGSKEFSSEEIKLLVNTCALKNTNSEEEDFHSLAFINKKLNEENQELVNDTQSVVKQTLNADHPNGTVNIKSELSAPASKLEAHESIQSLFDKQFMKYLEMYMPEVLVIGNDFCNITKNMVATQNNEDSSKNYPSEEELISMLRESAEEETQDDILASFSENSSKFTDVLKKVFLHKTGNKLICDKSDKVCLKLDLEIESQREFITSIEGIRLPAIDTIILENFYEGDEELETFLSENISCVNNLILKADGYCVDFHDYCEKLQDLDLVKNLYLKGFLIDTEDTEHLLGQMKCQKIVFEGCKVAIDEDFCIHEEDDSTNYSILQSLHFINDEMEEEEMKRLAKAIKCSSCEYSFKTVTVLNCSLDQEQRRLGFSIEEDASRWILVYPFEGQPDQEQYKKQQLFKESVYK